MTTARSRAIALLDDMTGHAYQQSCTAFVDAVLSAAEGRTQKTSGTGTPNPLATQGEVSTVSTTTPARGPEEAGTNLALEVAREVLEPGPAGDMWLAARTVELAREVVRLHESMATCTHAWSKRTCAAGRPHWHCARCPAERVAGKHECASPAAPASSDGRPDREALGRRWWIGLDVDGPIAFATERDARSAYPDVIEVVPAARAEATERTLARLTADYRKETSRLEDMAAHHEKGHNDAVARAESASRERDAALARAEAAEAKAQQRLDALYEVSQACRIGASPDRPEIAVPRGVREMLSASVAWTDREKLRGAEVRVRQLEAEQAETRRTWDACRLTNLQDGAADMRERAAQRIDGWRAWGRPQDLSAAVRALPLRPTAPAADDGDEKEKTT